MSSGTRQAMSSRKPIGRRTESGRRAFWSWVLVTSAAAALLCVHVWTRVTVIEKSYRIGQARDEGAKLSTELAALKTEVATLRNLRRLDQDARTKLQMGPAQKVVVLKAVPGVKPAEAPIGDAKPSRQAANGARGAATTVVATALAAN